MDKPDMHDIGYSIDNPRTPLNWKIQRCEGEISYWRDIRAYYDSKLPELKTQLVEVEQKLSLDYPEPKNDDELAELLYQKNSLEAQQQNLTVTIEHLETGAIDIIKYYEKLKNEFEARNHGNH